MGKYEQRNSRVIEKAFSRPRKQMEETTKSAYYGFMEDALRYLLSAHESTDFHVNEDDTIGVGIIHDGRIVEVWGWAGGGRKVAGNEATRMIESLVPQMPRSGWVGIVLSGMRGYYSVEKEMDHLMDTVDWSEENFLRYFKPIG